MDRPFRGRGGGRFGFGGPRQGRGRGRGTYYNGNRHRHHNSSNNNNHQFRNNNNNHHRNRMSLEDDTTVIEEIPSPDKTSPSVRIAVEGCCHGELQAIYQRLQRHEQQQKAKASESDTPYRPIDLLICCGDFQSLRNLADFHSLAVPPKYRAMGSFYKYYSGELTAPYLTIFVGGNHEASQPLHELYYGGWVAPRIYYLGAAGVVRYKGLRIGGVSGIYKRFDYARGRTERPPYDRSTNRSIYHVRNVDVYRMMCLQKRRRMQSSSSPKQDEKDSHSSRNSYLDVMVSHDWPQGIAHHGDTQGLLRRKPYFRAEVEEDTLGSPPNKTMLHALQPKWWLAAHLHVKFRATVVHKADKSRESQQSSQLQKGTGSITDLVPSAAIQSIPTATPRKRKADEKEDVPMTELSDQTATESINQDVSTSSNTNEPLASSEQSSENTTQFVAPEQGSALSCNPQMDLTEQMTQFLSLDKCLPRRHFLTIIDVPTTQQPKYEDGADSSTDSLLEYDPEWLAILRKTHTLTSTRAETVTVPSDLVTIDKLDIEWIHERFPSLEIPQNFVTTVPPIPPGVSVHPVPHQLPPPYGPMGNPQTDQLLDRLELEHIVTVPYSNNLDQAVELAGDQTMANQESEPIELNESQNQDQPGDDNEIDLDDLDDE